MFIITTTITTMTQVDRIVYPIIVKLLDAFVIEAGVALRFVT